MMRIIIKLKKGVIIVSGNSGYKEKDADAKALINEILNPENEFTPIPFWFLNDYFEEAELKRQLMDFCDKGVYGVVLHPRIGVPDEIGYLSDEFFDVISYIVETANSLGMKVVLYDEGMYPSGSACGQVVKANPELAARGIIISDNADDGEVVANLSDGRFIVYKKTEGTLRGIHYGEDDWDEGAPKVADILNEDAVELFIKLTHDEYYKHLSKYFGNTIIGIFTDEPTCVGRGNGWKFKPWYRGALSDLTERGGKPEELAALFDNETNKTTAIHKKLISEKINNTYYKRLYDWCEEHNIALMGHPSKSDDIDEERFFHIPGQDLVLRRVGPETGGTTGMDSVMAKCSADAARYMGRRRNSNEAFGVCVRDEIPWYMTAADIKWYTDWLGVRGVNMFIPHAFFYSVRDKRSEERPPDVGPNNIWWEHYKKFSGYMSSISYIMTDSKNFADVAVLCNSGAMKEEAVKEFFENQVEFNYVPYSFLDKCEVEDGKLKVGDYTYSYVLGDTDLPVKTIKSVSDVEKRDFSLSKNEKDLRLTHLRKAGVEMIFAVNEGESEISTELTHSISRQAIEVDLWNQTAYKTENSKIKLSLKPRESVLYVFAENADEFPVKPQSKKIDNLIFNLIDDDTKNYKKTYVAAFFNHKEAENRYFEVNCEEMAECYVNDEFCDVAFFNHRFEIGKFLKEGKNSIKLVITGNIANKYNEDKIFYGIK